jgi:HlyD family secretion protein
MAEQTRPWLRRLLIAGVVVAALAALVWWLGRPKPVAVVLTEVGRGTVEATIANTRAGTVEACQRTKLSTIAGAASRCWP